MIVPPRQIRVVNGTVYTAGSTCPDEVSHIKEVYKATVDVEVVEDAAEVEEKDAAEEAVEGIEEYPQHKPETFKRNKRKF